MTKRDISIEKKLEERIKELSCLYEVSSALRKHTDSIADTLWEICYSTQRAWMFSDIAIVHLKYEDHEFITSGIPDKNISQESIITVAGEAKGFLKIYYDLGLHPAAYFLEEEQKLLDKIALEIEQFFERQDTKKKEEVLRRSAERNDRLSILGEITAGIAHELNTPLGNILGFSELIKSQTKDKQVQADSEKIIKAAIYSREVVKKLMFFACEMPQNKKWILVKPVIEQALRLLGQNFKKAQVHYEFRIDNNQLKAQLDSIQFTQILFNLLINAIYVSPPKGKITIEIKSNSEAFEMRIIDQGPGIPEKLKSKIFEPFFTTKPVGEGSGLGLSVVHGIIKSHRGEIVTFDNPPAGTVFQINLPLKI